MDIKKLKAVIGTNSWGVFEKCFPSRKWEHSRKGLLFDFLSAKLASSFLLS